MRRWSFDARQAGWENSQEASQVRDAILAGQLVAVPTETVYGLAADATNAIACANIFEAKGRPNFNPLISHFATTSAAKEHGHFNEHAETLAQAFWPGPLTLVVSKKAQSSISDLATAGLDTVALRVPASPAMQFVSRATQRPIAAPSANLSGRVSPTCADDVVADLGQTISYLIDAGRCRVGIESTIISCIDEKPRLLRPGGISRQKIEETLNTPLLSVVRDEASLSAPLAPGLLSSHYAPAAKIRLNVTAAEPGEGLLSFGPKPPLNAKLAAAEFNLSPTGDLVEAAANLFFALRTLDSRRVKTIHVQVIPSIGLGEAINDRLLRAAAPRP